MIKIKNLLQSISDELSVVGQFTSGSEDGQRQCTMWCFGIGTYFLVLKQDNPLYLVQGNIAGFPCARYKGKHFLNFDNVPVKVHLNKLDFCNLLIKIFNLIPKFLMDFYRKIVTRWAPHCAMAGMPPNKLCSNNIQYLVGSLSHKINF